MEFELTQLEAYFNQLLHAASQTNVIAYQDQLAQEKKRIQKTFQDVDERQHGKIEWQKFIAYHHLRLVELKKKLHTKGKNQIPPSELKEVFSNTVDELLFFMDLHFPNDAFSTSESNKIITTISVEELALFCRLFHDCGIYRIKEKVQLARFMSQHVSTQNKNVHETLSIQHFYSSYYKIEEGAFSAVEKYLSDMLYQLGKLRKEARKTNS